MAIRFELKAALLAALLVGACGDEEEPQSPDDTRADRPSSAKDGGRGKADAGTASEDEDDEEEDAEDDTVDEPSEDEMDEGDEDDVGSETGSKLDAGRPDAGGASADAGKPASGSDAGSSGGGDALSCEALTYESFGKSFFMSNCVACHTGAAAQGMLKLDSLPEVTKNKAAVLREAVREKKMPPPPMKLSDGDLQKLEKFLECGPK